MQKPPDVTVEENGIVSKTDLGRVFSGRRKAGAHPCVFCTRRHAALFWSTEMTTHPQKSEEIARKSRRPRISRKAHRLVVHIPANLATQIERNARICGVPMAKVWAETERFFLETITQLFADAGEFAAGFYVAPDAAAAERVGTMLSRAASGKYVPIQVAAKKTSGSSDAGGDLVFLDGKLLGDWETVRRSGAASPKPAAARSAAARNTALLPLSPAQHEALSALAEGSAMTLGELVVTLALNMLNGNVPDSVDAEEFLRSEAWCFLHAGQLKIDSDWQRVINAMLAERAKRATRTEAATAAAG